ncbi:hypothetical protein KRR38_33540 [Novosphingobium sp. G106]|uniref:hypothetical protein n=1 Tax=Novosphingobium sp. G106 TaxID=2849500 RepID=UPI001C2D7757|nr:hypothetical protein [Novosphingobium sp. G106]MBV1692161.1 hypothetical protein [Novosphingobium sp. G106]MBV1692430.1 hypothetical protein [Novosphingobium sp. G106]
MTDAKSGLPQNAVERAFELAKSGAYRNIKQVSIQLDKEGYLNAREYLAGRSIRLQLLGCVAS